MKIIFKILNLSVIKKYYVKRHYRLAMLFLVSFLSPGDASAGFTVTLYDGIMHGPGNLGEHDINGGYLKNFIVTSTLTGSITFFNNGESLPNVFAENQHTGPVDGKLSDGTTINENIDAAFVIRVNEPETQKLIELFICSVSAEVIEPDQYGNLLFKLNAAFDTGFAEDVIQIPIQFTTGLVEVPRSDKTQRSLKGGHDGAGRYPAGSLLVGRLGDNDNDGLLDGTFVLAGNTPRELIIVEGDPVLITRPFRSDIPVTPQEAFFYEINGIVQNFPLMTGLLIKAHKFEELAINLADIEHRLTGANNNLDQAMKEARRAEDRVWVENASMHLKESVKQLAAIEALINKSKHRINISDKIQRAATKFFSTLEELNKYMVEERGRFI